MLFHACFHRGYRLSQPGGSGFNQLPAFSRISFRNGFLQLAGDPIQRTRQAFRRFAMGDGECILYGLH